MIDRTKLIASLATLRLRLVVWVFAVGWAVRWYQMFGDGIWLWAVFGWMAAWTVKKFLKRRKEQKRQDDGKVHDPAGV